MENKHWTELLAPMLIANKIETFLCVADRSIALLIQSLKKISTIHIIQACREDEGIGIASGAYLAGKRGVMMMQSSGFGMSLNALSFCIAGEIPMVLVIAQRGLQGEAILPQVPIGQAVIPILKTLKIPFCDNSNFLKKGNDLIYLAFRERRPVAFVLPAV